MGWKGTGLNIHAACDHNCIFTDLKANFPSSAHDVTVFRRSRLPEMTSNIEGFLLGDSGYKGMSSVVQPFSNPSGKAEKLFNLAHKATRTRIEHAFGYWKTEFPILKKLPNMKINRLPNLIIATAVLYNIKRMNRKDFLVVSPKDLVIHGEDDISPLTTTNPNEIREILVQRHFRRADLYGNMVSF